MVAHLRYRTFALDLVGTSHGWSALMILLPALLILPTRHPSPSRRKGGAPRLYPGILIWISSARWPKSSTHIGLFGTPEGGIRHFCHCY